MLVPEPKEGLRVGEDWAGATLRPARAHIRFGVREVSPQRGSPARGLRPGKDEPRAGGRAAWGAHWGRS